MNSVASDLPSQLLKQAPIALIATAAVAAACLRWHYASEPLWVDELHTAWATDCPFSEVASRAGQGNQGPIYFWLIWFIKSLCGDGEFVLRVPSVILGILTLVCASCFVWKTGRSISGAILSATIITVDAQFVFMSTEARPYALVQLLAILQIIVFCDEVDIGLNEKSSRKGWVNWKVAILTAALLLSHLTTVWIVIAEASFVLLFWKRVHAKRLFISLAAGSLGLLPSLLILKTAFDKRDDWFIVSDVASYVRESGIQIVILIVMPTVLLLASRVLFVSDRTMKFRSRPLVLFLLAWCAIVPIVCCTTLQLAHIAPLAIYRYSLVGSVAFPVFCGLVIAEIRNPVFRRISALAVVTLAVCFNPIADSLVKMGQLPRFRKENWKIAINAIETTELSSKPIFLFANLVEDYRAATLDWKNDTKFSRYLLFPLTGQFKLPGNNTIIPMPTMIQTHWKIQHVQLIRESGGGWIVSRSTPSTADAIADELEQLATGYNLKLSVSVAFFEPGNNVLVMKIDPVIDPSDQPVQGSSD